MSRRACAAVLGLAATLAVACPAAAQPRRVVPARPERSPFLDGTHAFRHILYVVGRKNLNPLRERDLGAGIDPKSTLVVVLGDPSPLTRLDGKWGGLGPFVSEGGALLVATDQATPPALGNAFGVRVNGAHVTVPGGGPDAFRGMPECPWIDPAPGANPPLFEPALRAGRDGPAGKVASNLPSFVQLWAVVGWKPLPYLADLPRSASARGAFAAGGNLRAGRLLVMADQDVFINEMMLQRDNGNIDFSYRLADWLLTRPDGQGKRDRILFYEDGQVQTDFEIPLRNLPPPPLPPPDTLMGMLDEMLPAMEQEGFFAKMEEDDLANDAVEDLATSAPVWEGTRPEWKLWTMAAIVGSVALGLYGFVRLGTFRHRAASSGPTLAEFMLKQAPAGTVMAQRQLELLRDGNLWEAARDLTRQTFLSVGLSPDASPLPPPIEVAGPWWRRWLVRQRWRRLWRLARSPRPVRVSPRGFGRLAEQVRALRAGLAGGTVRILR